jgi:ABC-2 type transport system permease protein
MMVMRVLLWKELLEQWRSYRMLMVIALLTAFGIVGPLTARYLNEILAAIPNMPQGLALVLPKPDVTMSVEQLLKNFAQFGLILALLVPMAAVAGEKTSGTAAMTLSKPVSRAAFLVAKLSALAITFALGVAAGTAVGYAYTGLLFTWMPPAGFAALAALLLAYLLAYVSITLMASTLMRSQLAAAGLAFGIAIVCGLLSSVPTWGHYFPAGLLPWAQQLALGANPPAEWAALAVTLGVIPVMLGIAWISLRRQEL